MADREKIIKGLRCIAGEVVWCAQCPYSDVNGSGRGDRCKRECAKDALALQKAQQPRVMTLEEVKIAEVVWLEQVGVCVCAIKIQNSDSGTMSFAYAYNNCSLVVNIEPEYYGTISRCWTSRPTDEQMEAVKWDG